MAVKIVCLAADGAGGRLRGAIMHIQEGATLDAIRLGKKDCPPTFFVIGIPDKGIKDLPKEWLDYGGHKSRMLIEVDKLSPASVSDLAKDAVVELPIAAVTAVVKDQIK